MLRNHAHPWTLTTFTNNCTFSGRVVNIYLLIQRNMVYAWDMKGSKPSFAPKPKEFNGLELPQGTVLEVELVQELQGEV